MRFKIDWASLIVGSKFAVFALFYFVFEGNFPNTSPRGAYIWRGDLTEGFLRYRIWGLIFGGAYTSRGLFSEFYGITTLDLEPEFFSGKRTPALNDYALRRPSCLLESIERLYQSSFIFCTGPQNHYTQRKLGPKAPVWLRKSHGKRKP